MAWFRRSRDDSAPVEQPAPESPPSVDADRGDVVRAERSRPGDWMALPPLSTTVGPPPSTFRVQRVSEIMTTRRPMVFLGSLGHQVSPSAPSGHVEGLTTTVAPAVDSSNQIDLPLHGRTPAPSEEPAPPHPTSPSAPAAATSPPSEPAAPAAPPAAQRSVRELAPGEPVTAHTLGVAREAVPVVQRSIAATSSTTSSPPAPLRRAAALPDPSPTRVLREPTRAASVLEARTPSLPVVDSPLAAPAPEGAAAEGEGSPTPGTTSTPWGDEAPAGDFIAPEQPVEVVVRASDPVGPSAVDTPLQRAIDAAVAPTAAREGTVSPEMPLVAPNAGTPATTPGAGELMPPIQPRSLQRRAETAASTAPTPEAERRADDHSLPPLPSWALAPQHQHQAPPGQAPEESPTGASEPLPLHISRHETVQRHASDVPDPAPAISESPTDAVETSTIEDDDADATTLQRSADAPATSPPVSHGHQAGEADQGTEQVAPLVGELAVGFDGHPLAGHTSEPDDAAAPLDLALHQPSASFAAPEDAPDRHPSAEAGDPETPEVPPAADDATIAPLLGDRALPLQRSPAPGAAAPVEGSASMPGEPRPAELPLVVDPGSGPTLPSASHARSAPLPPLASGGAVQRTATSALAAGPMPTLHGASPHGGSTQMQALAGSLLGPSAAATNTAQRPGDAPVRDLPALALAISDAPEGSTPRPASASLPLAVQTLAAPAAPDVPRPAAMPLQAPGRVEAGVTLGDAAVAAGVAQRLDDGSVVFTGPGAAAGEQGGVTLPIQRLAEPGPAATLPDAAPAAVQRVETTAAPSETGGDPAAEQKQNDELADKVYERIRWKLESDLFAERWRVNAGAWSRRER